MLWCLHRVWLTFLRVIKSIHSGAGQGRAPPLAKLQANADSYSKQTHTRTCIITSWRCRAGEYVWWCWSSMVLISVGGFVLNLQMVSYSDFISDSRPLTNVLSIWLQFENLLEFHCRRGGVLNCCLYLNFHTVQTGKVCVCVRKVPGVRLYMHKNKHLCSQRSEKKCDAPVESLAALLWLMYFQFLNSVYFV